MGDKDPKKKPLVMDAVKPQDFSEAETEDELNAIEAEIEKEKKDSQAEEHETSKAQPEAQEDSAEQTPEPEADESKPESEESEPEANETETSSEEVEPEPEQPAEKSEIIPEEQEVEPTVSGLEEEDANKQTPQKEVDAPTFAEQLEQTHEQGGSLSNAMIKQPKKERVIFKILRIIIWLFVAIMLPTSIFIINNSEKITAYAYGTHSAQLSFGRTLFWITLIVYILNLIWGVVRWIMYIVCNHCGIGRIIGKLFGGGIWRFLVFTPIVLVSLIFIAPIINNKVRTDAFDQNNSANSDIFYCSGLCTKKYSIEKETPKRIYLSTLNSTKTKVTVQAPDSVSISLYKTDGSVEQRIAGDSNNTSYTSGLETEILFITSEITSTDEITDPIEFIVTVTPEELEGSLKKQEIDFEAKNPFRKLENSCTEINVKSLLDVPGEISGFIKGIKSDMDFSDISKKLDKIKTNAQETKNSFEGYLISICTSEFKEKTNYSEIRSELKNTLGSDSDAISVDFDDSNDGGMKKSVFGIIDALKRSGKVYVLLEIDNNPPALFSINIDSK